MNKNSKRKILFLTGTRADFGKLKSLINEVENDENFDALIFVTGMHLLRRYGSTFREVEESNYKYIHKYFNQYINEPMEVILANTIHGLSRYVHEVKPDMIVVHGDRVEALAGAIVGSLNNILVAHIEGGERSGTVDELLRHSITKLSHIHLVSNQEAFDRVVQMGEKKESVFIIGSADIDFMREKESLPTIEMVKKHYDIQYEKYHIVLFHPVTTEIHLIEENAHSLVNALIESEENFIVIYPNNDQGTNYIIDAYKKLEGNPRIKIFPSLRFEYFITLIDNATSLIGNSSAGIREAPIYGVPSINIGSRQSNRFKHDSIIDVTYRSDDILKEIKEISLKNKRYKECNYFGIEKSSGKEFMRILNSESLWKTSSQKIFFDL